MSSILLSNPFPAPPPAGLTTPEPLAAVAIAPTQAAASASDTGDAASFRGSGTGSGTSNQGDTVALIQSRSKGDWQRPSDATGRSVIGAQAQDDAGDRPFGSDLPKVDMPDPLPTSPFLKNARKAS